MVGSAARREWIVHGSFTAYRSASGGHVHRRHHHPNQAVTCIDARELSATLVASMKNRSQMWSEYVRCPSPPLATCIC